MKTPDYVLSEDFIVYHGFSPLDTKTIPAGSFVRPVEASYVPKHILEDSQWKPFNAKTETFAYTRYGFIKILRTKIREVS